jgi:hypothetical protein
MPDAESHDDAMGRVPVPGPVCCRLPGDLQLAGADFGHFRVRGAGQFTGVMAASAFASVERVLNVGIGVAQLRLANLVQGDWLSRASQVAYQGGIDHLIRAGPFDDLPGTSRLVGSSSWIRCTGTAPIKTPKASGNSRIPARLNPVLRVHGCWGDPASEPESAR